MCFCCLHFGASVWELQQVATHFLWLYFVVVVAAADAAVANAANKTNEKGPTHTQTGTLTYTNTHNHAQAIYISTADIKGKCEEKTENKKENFSASQGVAATTTATIRKFQLLFP